MQKYPCSTGAKLKFHWRVILLLVCAIALMAIAIALRESSWIITSTQWIWEKVEGNYPPWSFADAIANFLLLFAVVVAAIWVVLPRLRHLFRKQRNSTDAKQIGSHGSSDTLASAGAVTLLSDVPLGDPTDDELVRAHFSRDLVYTITVAPPANSFVMSVEGPWGEGKTTILNWVHAALQLHGSQPVLVRFDPWPEDSKRGVVARLLDTIAVALNSRSDLPEAAKIEATRLFGRLADAAASELPSSYGLVRGIAGWLAYPDKANYRPHRFSGLDIDRTVLKECVARLDHRLVILIDDLDRVDGDELRSILMAVNALSAFSNTVIVMAFDPFVVDAALEALGFGSIKPGSNFREKIIQVSRPLPRPTFSDLKRLLEKSLNHVLTELDAKLTWDSWSPELAQQAILVSTQFSKSPRSIKRLANHTGLLVARLQREVNSGDVLLLELLRAQYADAWYFVRANTDLFNPRHYDLTDRSSKDGKSPIARAVERIPAEFRPACENIMNMLFPKNDEAGTRRVDPEEEAQSRVSVGKNLLKYFHLGVESDDISDTDARAFIRTQTDRSRLLVDCAKRDSLGALFVSASAQIGTEVVPQIPNLVELVIHASASAWKEKAIDLTEEATLLLYTVIESIPEQSERVLVLNAIASNEASISISQSLVLDLLQHGYLWDSGNRIQPPQKNAFYSKQLVQTQDLEQVSKLWVNTAWKVGVPEIFEKEPLPVAILFRMAQLEVPADEGYKRVRTAMQAFLESTSNLVKFVSHFSERVRGVNYGISGVEKLVPDWRAFLVRAVDLKEPSDAIEKFREALEDLSHE